MSQRDISGQEEYFWGVGGGDQSSRFPVDLDAPSKANASTALVASSASLSLRNCSSRLSHWSGVSRADEGVLEEEEEEDDEQEEASSERIFPPRTMSEFRRRVWETSMKDERVIECCVVRNERKPGRASTHSALDVAKELQLRRPLKQAEEG